ncbi:hypothetical protein X962_5656 [Burkholderia pseudomallei MSHR7343]|nr:hypothetical protein X962_5656 [Burkholderia pseudomallei MSHR7343]
MHATNARSSADDEFDPPRRQRAPHRLVRRALGDEKARGVRAVDPHGRHAAELRMIGDDDRRGRRREHPPAHLGDDARVIGQRAVRRDPARADEREIDVVLRKLVDRVEAERRVLVVGEFAAEQRHAVAVAPAEHAGDPPVVRVDAQAMAIGERERHRVNRAARVEQHRRAVGHEFGRTPADRAFRVRVRRVALGHARLVAVGRERAAMRRDHEAARGERVQIAADRLARHVERVHELRDRQRTRAAEFGQDVAMTLFSKHGARRGRAAGGSVEGEWRAIVVRRERFAPAADRPPSSVLRGRWRRGDSSAVGHPTRAVRHRPSVTGRAKPTAGNRTPTAGRGPAVDSQPNIDAPSRIGRRATGRACRVSSAAHRRRSAARISSPRDRGSTDNRTHRPPPQPIGCHRRSDRSSQPVSRDRFPPSIARPPSPHRARRRRRVRGRPARHPAAARIRAQAARLPPRAHAYRSGLSRSTRASHARLRRKSADSTAPASAIAPASTNADTNEPLRSTMNPVTAGPMTPDRLPMQCRQPLTAPTRPGATMS